MLKQSLPHIARGHANNGVFGGVVGRRPSEQVDADLAFSQVDEMTLQRPFNDMLDKFLAPVAPFERRTIYDFLHVCPKLGRKLDCMTDLGNGCRVSYVVNSPCHLEHPARVRIELSYPVAATEKCRHSFLSREFLIVTSLFAATYASHSVVSISAQFWPFC
jgi:hypothetical protein